MPQDEFWVAREPAAWPASPSHFSYSSLSRIEACPRRWALANADWEELWRGRGYPARPSIQQLSGEVVHLAVSEVIRALVAAGAHDPTDVAETLRSIGGLSQVVSDCVTRVLSPLNQNPRMGDRVESLVATLTQRIGVLRLDVQAALSVSWEGSCSTRPIADQGEPRRQQLGYGQHSEVWLAPKSIPVVGRADLIRLDEQECEIVDYKTGEPDASHSEQLLEYSLLWARDRVVNPGGRLATQLGIVYGAGLHRVPAPSLATLADIERALRRRCQEARDAVSNLPPRAFVATDNCRYCDVKHLCAAYWTPSSQSELKAEQQPPVRSLQAVAQSPRGETLWSVAVELDPYLPYGQVALAAVGRRYGWAPGTRVRLMDVRVDRDEDDRSVVIGALVSSEFYVVPA